jgi:hypothetical protein
MNTNTAQNTQPAPLPAPLIQLPRKKHSHRCQKCGAGVYCYKSQCLKPQRVTACQYCPRTA